MLEEIQEYFVCPNIKVTQMRSSVSQMRVILIDTEGPVVNAFFCIPTEAFDDDGNE